MTVTGYWASVIKELIAEARTSGVKITGFYDDRGIGLKIDAGLHSDEVMINDD